MQIIQYIGISKIIFMEAESRLYKCKSNFRSTDYYQIFYNHQL